MSAPYVGTSQDTRNTTNGTRTVGHSQHDRHHASTLAGTSQGMLDNTPAKPSSTPGEPSLTRCTTYSSISFLDLNGSEAETSDCPYSQQQRCLRPQCPTCNLASDNPTKLPVESGYLLERYLLDYPKGLDMRLCELAKPTFAQTSAKRPRTQDNGPMEKRDLP